MEKRLDNRPNLYGEQRLSNAQVMALETLASFCHVSGDPVDTELMVKKGVSLRTLASLERRMLVRQERRGRWMITHKGCDLLSEIRIWADA